MPSRSELICISPCIKIFLYEPHVNIPPSFLKVYPQLSGEVSSLLHDCLLLIMVTQGEYMQKYAPSPSFLLEVLALQ